MSVALDLDDLEVAQWQRKGYFRKLQLDGGENSQGVPRQFTLLDVFKIALFQKLLTFGLQPEKAAFFAVSGVEAVDASPDQARHLIFGVFAGYETLDFLKEIKPWEEELISFKVDLHALFHRVAERLRASEKSHASFNVRATGL